MKSCLRKSNPRYQSLMFKTALVTLPRTTIF
nr:MAG TPA: hypothetical protein [Caudoviricetes sp.]